MPSSRRGKTHGQRHRTAGLLAAWVWTAPDTEDVLGDLLTQFDPVRRRGFNFGLKASAGGYSSHGDDRHVFFGIDDGRVSLWEDCGRPSPTSNYISNSLTVFNGKLYGGSIPRSAVFRYDDGIAWTSMGRFLEPTDYEFKNPNEWARVTSLTVYGGKLFASMGSCTSSHLDAPADFRGKVFAMQADQCVSYDRDLGPGWKHLAAVRRGERLELYFNGSRKAESAGLDQAAFDLSTNSPLRIGTGETDSFSGRIREVRLYRGALSAGEIHRLAAPDHHPESGSTTP